MEAAAFALWPIIGCFHIEKGMELDKYLRTDHVG